MPSKQLARVPAKWRKAVLGFAVVCVAAAMMLMTDRQPVPAEGRPRVETSIDAIQVVAPVVAEPAPTPPAPQTTARPVAARPAATKPAAAKPAATKPAAATAAAAIPAAATPAAVAVGHTAVTAEPAAKPPVDSPAPAPETAGAVIATAKAQGEAATIIGCLELDDDTFRLKDTEGENAPKARSWRSGFLRRSSARLNVVDASNRLQLSTHVGHRVSLTGTLVEREMHARSVKMVADSCDN
jgi:hypothetical protein